MPSTTTAVAFRPDGKRVYVSGLGGVGRSLLLVIDTAKNTVVATIELGAIFPASAIGIVPPPPGVPFLAMSASAAITFGGAPNRDTFQFHSNFTLSGTDSNGIDPLSEAVTVQVGTFTATIPRGSFEQQTSSSFTFVGALNGVTMQATIKQTGTLRYAFSIYAQGADLSGSQNPIQLSLIIGNDSGTMSVNAVGAKVATK